ncbi:MAG: hypothetical protein WCD76_21065 [Pyrinomonadaceae bacterium]
MGRRHVVKDLSEVEFDFVLNAIMGGQTDREISIEFEHDFGKRLAKSSLNRWRTSAGDELADRYRLARFQARQLLIDLKEEDRDKYQIILSNIEDRLLTATREVLAKDPVKLLKIRQEEERRRLREKELELRREQIQFEREKLHGAAINKIELSSGFLADLLEYIGEDANGLRWFQGNAKKFEEYLKGKYAEAEG